METEIKIDYLANHIEFVPVIGEWFYNEWKRYYVSKTKDDIIKSIKERNNINCLPLCIVAFRDDKPIGTATLKLNEMPGKAQYNPWLAGVYVEESSRSRGIGRMLVERVLAESKRFGCQTIYLWTPTAMKYYEAMGWEPVEESFYLVDKIQIMKYTFP